MFRPSLGHPQRKQIQDLNVTVAIPMCLKLRYKEYVSQTHLIYLTAKINKMCLTDVILVSDPRLHRFFIKMHCGIPSAHILWALGIPQCIFIKNLCNLGSVFFEGLRMTH